MGKGGLITLYRIGDFYEAFGEDAKAVAETCGSILCFVKIDGRSAPMTGFPYFSLGAYQGELEKAGYDVKIVDTVPSVTDLLRGNDA